MDAPRNRSAKRSRVRLQVVAVLSLACMLPVAACTLVQSEATPTPERPARQTDPAISAGTISTSAQATAARLLASSRRALESRDYERAAEDASRVITEFPMTVGSSEALWILARAAYANGDYPVAQTSAARFHPLIDPADRRVAEARLLGARAQHAMGDAEGAVANILALSEADARAVQSEADDVVREWVRDIETTRLGELIEGVPQTHPLLPPVWLEYGVGLHFAGQIDESAAVARMVLASEAGSQDREVARSLLSGSVSEAFGSAVAMGLVIPTSGSPTLRQYAQDVEDGVRVAVQMEAERRRRPVQITIVDDGGGASASGAGVASLERDRAIAIIGPILDGAMREVARARENGTVVISPTAASVPEGQDDMYSLAAPDAGGVQALAEYAAEQGYQRLAMIYPLSDNGEWEAQSFVDAYMGLGRGQIERFPYTPGSTTFTDQLADAERFGADLLVLPVPDSDVELIAPQVTFSGLDTLGVHVVGNAAWGLEETLERVDPRHTNGVVIASPRNPDAAVSPYDEFVAAYEGLHRKSLRSPIPAFGFDAARLILNALDAGARTPSDVARRLSETASFPGATGEISIQNGRITRRHYLYVIENRELLPANQRFE